MKRDLPLSCQLQPDHELIKNAVNYHILDLLFAYSKLCNTTVDKVFLFFDNFTFIKYDIFLTEPKNIIGINLHYWFQQASIDLSQPTNIYSNMNKVMMIIKNGMIFCLIKLN